MPSSSPSLVEEKRELRRALSARRAALSPEQRAEGSRRAVAWLAGLPEVVTARAVAGFAATAAEIDPAALLTAVERRGGTVAYPRVTKERPRLRFHRVTGQGDLRPGAFGILEPSDDCPEVFLGALDVILVPGLAFDRQGRRLGYGGGYYDEVGAVVRQQGRATLVGLGFDFQLVDRCPAGDGDVDIDSVVTDARVVRCRAPGIESNS